MATKPAFLTFGGLSTGSDLLLKRIAKLWTTSEHSDLQITCGGSSWEVHKAIVCPASPFFDACCKNFKEASTGLIELPDDDRKVVETLLYYMYTANYGTGFRTADLLHHVQVHTIADKYTVPDLCTLAEAKFAEGAATAWNTADFAEAVHEMYTTSPDTKQGLQKTAVEITIKHAKELFTAEASKFREITRQTAPFAFEVSCKFVEMQVHKENEARYCCGDCNKAFTCDNLYEALGFGRVLRCPYGCHVSGVSNVRAVK